MIAAIITAIGSWGALFAGLALLVSSARHSRGLRELRALVYALRKAGVDVPEDLSKAPTSAPPDARP